MKCVLILLLTINVVFSWNTCSDEYFCNRIRNEDKTSTLTLNMNSVYFDDYTVKCIMFNDDNKRYLALSIFATEMDIFRITLNDPADARDLVSEALQGELVKVPIAVTESSENLRISTENSEVRIQYSPFKILIYKDSRLILVINDNDKITFNSDDNDTAVAVDFTFPGTSRAYGIPEHAESLSLRSTGPGGLNPYRLYNADYPAYPIGTQEALYGSVPVLYAHGTTGTAGIFWLNSAQTFVDIDRGVDQIQTLFISETGAMDIFVLTGPTFETAVKQYTKLTGPAPLPQYFALGHHQSRWSYYTQEDVETVVREFDNHNLPLDVIWLDIDYTSAYKYFTWNYTAFPDPVGMQKFFNSTGRKAVLIIDPHIKVEEGYFVYDISKANDYLVKNPNGTDYEASCWPGLSSWIDFLKPEAADYYSSLYSMDSFYNVTDIVYFWNDMNEPAVFDVEEKTMPKDVIHNGNIPHRDIHNIYGFSQTMATYKGLLQRYDNRKRPFVLTRSHFAGTQRHSAIWTGDNYASWEHLQISFAMCLTQAISGISFCGADVGGFAGEVEEELFQRWYQAGAWLPFFRAHSEEAVARREPYLFREEVLNRFRNAIRQRYYYLPVWYTLFYEHERYGSPVITPLVYQYPDDSNALDIDDEWMVGRNILVHPIAKEGATEELIYLPGGENELWFDIDNNLKYNGGVMTVSITMDSVPVYHRGGSILTRKEIHRPSSVYMHSDPHTIYVFLDINDQAIGTLYIDDNESFNYRNNKYDYYELKYADSNLIISKIDSYANYEESLLCIKAIVIYKPPVDIKVAVVNDNQKYLVSYSSDKSYLKIGNLHLSVQDNISIKFV